jgi:hypothetical protein
MENEVARGGTRQDKIESSGSIPLASEDNFRCGATAGLAQHTYIMVKEGESDKNTHLLLPASCPSKNGKFEYQRLSLNDQS